MTRCKFLPNGNDAFHRKSNTKNSTYFTSAVQYLSLPKNSSVNHTSNDYPTGNKPVHNEIGNSLKVCSKTNYIFPPTTS